MPQVRSVVKHHIDGISGHGKCVDWICCVSVIRFVGVLHNPLDRRRKAGFPMIGKYFSNGWKISACFSNDWKNFPCVFQRLEKFLENKQDKTDNKTDGKQNGWPKAGPRDAQDRPLFRPLVQEKPCAGTRRGDEWEDRSCRVLGMRLAFCLKNNIFFPT